MLSYHRTFRHGHSFPLSSPQGSPHRINASGSPLGKGPVLSANWLHVFCRTIGRLRSRFLCCVAGLTPAAGVVFAVTCASLCISRSSSCSHGPACRAEVPRRRAGRTRRTACPQSLRVSVAGGRRGYNLPLSEHSLISGLKRLLKTIEDLLQLHAAGCLQ